MKSPYKIALFSIFMLSNRVGLFFEYKIAPPSFRALFLKNLFFLIDIFPIYKTYSNLIKIKKYY